MSDFASEFSLSITRALRDQLRESLGALTPAVLSEENLARLDRRGGVYELFLDGDLVYVGKAARSLPGRLGQHLRKLSGREGGLLDRVTFVCAYVAEDLDAVAPEKMLINALRDSGSAAWNVNGFGNKDPGKARDTSVVSAGHFDSTYPIRLDLPITVGVTAESTVGDVLAAVKHELPFTFRYGSSTDDKVTLRDTPSGIEPASPVTKTVAEWMGWLVHQLRDWVVISLPGYIIAYPSAEPSRFASRSGAWVSEAGSVVFVRHVSEFTVDEPAGDELHEEEEEVP